MRRGERKISFRESSDYSSGRISARAGLGDDPPEAAVRVNAEFLAVFPPQQGVGHAGVPPHELQAPGGQGGFGLGRGGLSLRVGRPGRHQLSHLIPHEIALSGQLSSDLKSSLNRWHRLSSLCQGSRLVGHSLETLCHQPIPPFHALRVSPRPRRDCPE